VGSINVDLVVSVARLPAAGETVAGGRFAQHGGGKSANQAVAAARVGASVAFVGAVGEDELGASAVAELEAEGIDVTHVARVDAPTGVALIAVDAAGENTIVVSPGANARVGPADVERAGDVLAAAAVTLIQHEIPPEAVRAALAAAGGTVVLNPAPARALVEPIDVLVPNRLELEALADKAGDPEELARGLRDARAVVVTLGADGALVVEGDRATTVAAPSVRAVDTTGAGDAFCGALAQALAGGAALADAVRWAVAAAAVSVTREGAQGGMPTREQMKSDS
jgi:ribokinase